MMLQQPAPDDYVIATGEAYSVREFLHEAFSRVDLDWSQYVSVDPRYMRPTEVDYLMGDASKARKAMGFQPKVSFKQLVAMMVDHDLEMAKQESTLINAGHNVPLRGVAHG